MGPIIPLGPISGYLLQLNCCLYSDDGVIEFDEFQSWMREHSPPAPDRASSDDDELNQLFRIFDKDGDGCICAADLRSTMKDLGLVLTRDDVAAMMKQVGLGADGKILHEGDAGCL